MTPPAAPTSRYRGRRRRILSRPPRLVLIVVAAALVLVLGSGSAYLLLGRKSSGTTGSAAPLASATPTATSAPGDNVIDVNGKLQTDGKDQPVAGTTSKGTTTTSGTEVTLPAKLGSRPLLTDPDYVGIGAGLDIKLEGVPDGASTVGGVYGDPNDGDIVLIAAAAADLISPESTLNTAFIDAAVGGLPLTGVTDVAPGKLGGSAKCGKAEAGGANLVMCGWADASSTGRIIWYFTSLTTAESEFAKLRAQIEKTSN